jgi:hypothetical protein
MYFWDPYTADRLREMHVNEALERAEVRRILREAGARQQGFLQRQSRWLLGRIGRLFVALGQRLLGCALPQAGPLAAPEKQESAI